MASIKTRPGPAGRTVYQAQVRRAGHPQKTRTFDRKSDAVAWANEIERAINRGYAIPSNDEERITLSEALDRYVSEPSVRAHRGYDRERYRAQALSRGPLGQLRLMTLSGRDLAEFRDKLLSRGRAPNTIRLAFALIASAYKMAATEWGMVTLRMPVVRKPKLPAGRERRLEVDEEGRLLDAAAEGRNGEIGPIIRFALATAMRRGEIAGMRWEDVDMRRRVVRVPETKDATEIRGRDVPLSSEALRVLKGLPRRIDGRVWTLSPDGITKLFRRACVRAGIKGLRFHDLRHEATSRLFEQGLNPMEVAAVTGHKTLQMLKRYTHLRAEDLAAKLG